MYLLKKIELENKLAILFNRYMDLLHTYEIAMVPSFYSMNEFVNNLNNDEKIENEYKSAIATYQLFILDQSLSTLHGAIILAINKIELFQTKYNNDWKYYATTERIESIEEYGSEDDSDYNEDGSIKYKDDKESLSSYTIKHDLKAYFSAGTWRGEYIGTSSKDDFRSLSVLIQNKTDFSIFKFFEAKGKGIPVYKYNSETGVMEEMTLADKVENDINQDIINNNVVEWFEYVIDKCNVADAYFKSIEDFKDENIKYEGLKLMLENIRDMKF